MDILKLNDIQERLINHLTIEQPLYSVGFEDFDKHYKVMLGNCTDITGYPYSGKTLVLMEILFNLSMKHGFKHLLHLPDSGKPEEVMATLMQKYIGKTFDKRFPNLITEGEIYKNINWIDEHFKILTYKDRPNPKEFWEFSKELDVQCASIDSWNYMRHDGKGTEYLADQLSFRNEFAEKHNKHLFTIIHPRNPTKMDYVDGKLTPPTAYNLMGGSEWNNNGKNIIVVDCVDNESFYYDIYFRKIKPRLVGKTGFVSLNFDIKTQKFYEGTNGYRNYAYGEREKFEEVKKETGFENVIPKDEKMERLGDDGIIETINKPF